MGYVVIRNFCMFGVTGETYAFVADVVLILAIGFGIGHYFRSKFFEYNTGDPVIRYTTAQFFKTLLLGSAFMFVCGVIVYLMIRYFFYNG